MREAWQVSTPRPVEPEPNSLSPATESHWTLPEPEPPPTGRRIGWLLVLVTAAAIVGVGVLLGLPESTDPDDGGWAEVAFVISPVLAFITGLAMAAVLWLVGRLGLADISASRARDAAIGGGCLGPIAFFVTLVLGANAYESLLSAGRGYLIIYTIPIAFGVLCALGAALVRRRPRPSP